MPKILVIHGAGMNMRGKVQLDVFGPMTYPALVAALSQVKFPTTEVHISNPIRRGPASQTAAVSQSVVAGFGIAGYALALRGIRDQLAAKK
jgi:3-dehydroquinate dehydratase